MLILLLFVEAALTAKMLYVDGGTIWYRENPEQNLRNDFPAQVAMSKQSL